MYAYFRYSRISWRRVFLLILQQIAVHSKTVNSENEIMCKVTPLAFGQIGTEHFIH